MGLLDLLDRRWTWLVVLVVALVASGAALGRALRRSAASAADVPLSPLTAGWRVGPDYPERRDLLAEEESDVAGEMDDVSAFASPVFDPGALAPEVRDFYERTADYELAYEVHWHRPFRVGAALASRATSRVEQLNLPGPRDSTAGRLDGRFARVAPDADPRPGARAWVRTNESGEAVFVAIYGHHEHRGVQYVNVAVPLPGANLSTVLRPENLGNGGIELTTVGGAGDPGGESDGDEGLYLVTPVGALGLPLDQRFRVWPADEAERVAVGNTADLDAPDGRLEDRKASVVATHEMWLFGRQFLTIRYAGRSGTVA